MSFRIDHIARMRASLATVALWVMHIRELLSRNRIGRYARRCFWQGQSKGGMRIAKEIENPLASMYS